MIALVRGEPLPLLAGCRSFFGTRHARDVASGTFHHRATSFSVPGADTLSHTVFSVLERAKRDLIALRMYDIDQDERSWTVAAGLPIYIGLFGRDPLAAGTQAAALTTDILAGTALVLPRWQGRDVDDWRDEQPGRMLHQARDGALSELNYNPLGRTYASATSTMFYAVAASELWHWTGDRERVGPLIEPALRAMRWIDEEGDLDSDGFYEYKPRSSASIQNQGWKDSDDAIVHADGSQVRPPIGTCEMQGFVFLSKLRLSELLFWFGRKDDARRLFAEALELQRRFNDAFWMPDARTFAMGLDPEKRQIRSIGSDPGLCLAAGIADQALAEPTATRMFAADMFSGWGIRALSADHPAFDPYSYHRGTVWPVDQGAIALGLARYGLHGHVALLCRAVFEAAALFEHHRLPECWSGHQRLDQRCDDVGLLACEGDAARRVRARPQGQLPRVCARDARGASADAPPRSRHDRSGELRAGLPEHPAPVGLLRVQARDRGLHRVAAQRAVPRQEPRAREHGAPAGDEHTAVPLVEVAPPVQATAGAADLSARGGADALYWAARHDRRDIKVGFPTVKAIWGNRVIPGLLDHWLAKIGYTRQQTDEPVDPNRLDNLWAPVPWDFGAHGPFDRRAKASSLELWFDIHRWSLGAVALCAAAIVGASARRAAAQRSAPWRRLLT